MKFNLLEFNRNFHYYWWLVKRRQRWAEKRRRPTWGIKNRWPTRSELWQRTRTRKIGKKRHKEENKVGSG
jgi:hypothetical protein